MILHLLVFSVVVGTSSQFILPSGISPSKLSNFTQTLWDADVNRLPSSLYVLQYQGHTDSHSKNDVATDRLIRAHPGLDAILARPSNTYGSLIALLDNYAVNVKSAEHRTAEEILEETAFLNKISKTKVMQLAHLYLTENNIITGDMNVFLKNITLMWFDLHSKLDPNAKCDGSEPQICYCAFEKIMVGTIDPHHNVYKHTVSGFHNWIHYYLLERSGLIDYKGYLAYTENPNIVDIRFTWEDAMAKATSFFIGTSPEFEIALYTVCAFITPDGNTCPVVINGHVINIYVSTRHGLQMSSASPHFDLPTNAPDEGWQRLNVH